MKQDLSGSKLWFEYHCWESDQSSDAQLWYRSHRQVDVLRCLDAAEADEEEVGRMYRVRFEDGFEHDVFEDELMDSIAEFYRPDPPTPLMGLTVQ